jgi:integrase
MAYSVYRRCACRNSAGRQLANRCPKLGSKGHGTWYFVANLTDVGGRRRQMRRGGFPTKKDAERAAQKVTSRADAGQIVDDKETTGQWLEAWLAGKRSLLATTRRSYEIHLRIHLIPKLGWIPLEKLRPGDIAAAYRAIEAERPEGRPPVGPATIRRIHATLRASLNSAVQQQRLPFSPASHVELPEAKRPKVAPWEPEELGRFLDAVQSDRHSCLYEVLSMTGLRRGEALGLRWTDLDLERGVLVVRQQLTQLGHEIAFGPPKTASGENRMVELDAGTVGVLLGHQPRQQIERADWGDAYEDQDLVFARENGAPIHPEFATRHFQYLARKAGLPPIRLHDLRHGSASLQLAAGVPMAVVSKRLGHSSISITADTYSHLLEGVGHAAAEAAAALVPRTIRDHNVITGAENEEPEAPSSGPNAGQTVVRTSHNTNPGPLLEGAVIALSTSGTGRR